jgi:hypothetical protein
MLAHLINALANESGRCRWARQHKDEGVFVPEGLDEGPVGRKSRRAKGCTTSKRETAPVLSRAVLEPSPQNWDKPGVVRSA